MTVTWLLLALAALDLNRECGYFCRDPVTIAHPLCKPSVRDVYDVYNSIGSTINIPEVCWRAPTVAGALSTWRLTLGVQADWYSQDRPRSTADGA